MSQVLIEPQVNLDHLTLRIRPVIELTDDEFFALCQLNKDLRFERTSQGDIIIMQWSKNRSSHRSAPIL